MNFGELITATLGSSFHPVDKRADAARYLNVALTKIGRRLRLPEARQAASLELFAGDPTVTLPANVYRFRGVEPLWFSSPGDTIHYPLEQEDLNVINAHLNRAQGAPTSYAGDPQTGQIVVYPTPSANGFLTLYYLAFAEFMDDDSDQPRFTGGATVNNRELEDALIQYARARLYGDEDDDQAMTTWLAMWGETVRELRADVADRNAADVPRRVPSMWTPHTTAPTFRRPGS